MARLRKPSVAAWAVNQLVRTQSRALSNLFDAGDAARQAQTELLSGQGDGEALRGALRHEREAVAALAEVAQGLLSSEGHELSPVMLERVSDTLDAAALDEDARGQVRDGCLERELRHVGLGPTISAPVAAARRQKPTAKRKQATPKARQKPSTPPRDAAALRKAEAAARRAADRAAKEIEAAQARRDAAAQALEAAEADLMAARRSARELAAAHRKARHKLK